MNKIAFLTVLALLFVSLTLGQSGRRITAPPAPVTTKTEVQSDYSETKPIEKRPIYRRPVKNSSTNQKSIPVSTSGEAVPVDEGEVIKVESDLITIPVSVFDRNGLYIPGLKKDDFKIFEDGAEQDIAYFGTSEKPFTVVLLLDTSPSTEYKIDDIRNAAISFVDQLKAQDKVMVIEFDQDVHVLTEPTGDRQAIYKAIRRADFGWGTSLYDTVRYTIAKKLSTIEGRKAIVLFTDGVDTTSSRGDYDSTIAMAEEADALIFPIYYNTFLDGRGGVGGINGGMLPTPNVMAPGGSAKEYALGKQYLEDLAAYTGGRVFRPESTPGGLTAAFEGIAEELRRQYNIGYMPKKDGTPGQRKQIKVRVDKANLVIRSRDSYIVGKKAGT
jgi:Ca-activated chloride channel homolog